MKRYLAMLGAAMFFVACFSLYLMMESVSSGNQVGMDDGLSHIELKIRQIEDDLKNNHETINMIKDTVRNFAKNGGSKNLGELQKVLDAIENKPVIGHKFDQTTVWHPKNIYTHNVTGLKKSVLQQSQGMCSFSEQPAGSTDVQMMDVYDKLAFNNEDGGVWKQGFPISYDTKQYQGKPLQVFVVPHSHCDPGWLKTFERYYSDQTRHILNNMVDKLEQYPKMRFIYAEMSFFSMWWNEIDERRKERVKKLLQEKRLEIVTGGWVMNDEANTHYFAMVDQMIEGNQWLLNQLGFKPQTGWAIDPFGHSPTMAYLLHKMGFNQMLIQRTHYEVKKALSSEKHMEFLWRQNWDNTGKTDILCHMMPFYSYDVPHTCGPDPAVCCQFDFKRLPGGKISCPWKIPPQPINDANVAQKAETLLDQYRKKSALYQNNVVLIPLGDDFRYDKPKEWDDQFNNYQKLFDYMNSRTDWNVQAQFGTLSDYFAAVHTRAGSQPGDNLPGYPTLSGDFFTYADRDEHYWSGYFTSRPFYKRLDRELEAHLRGGEILFSQAVMHGRHEGTKSYPVELFMKHLVTGRRSLGLFQHHDGITGTAKDFVMVDYGNKMLESIRSMKLVMKESAQFLLSVDRSQYHYDPSVSMFDVDEQRLTVDSLPDRTVLSVSDNPRSVIFYNSLGHSRTQIVCVHVSKPSVEVKDSEGHTVQSQVNPFWNTLEEIATDKFKLIFVVNVPAMGLSTYTVKEVPNNSNPRHSMADITVYNPIAAASPQSNEHFQVTRNTGANIFVENIDLKVHVSTTTGTLEAISMRETGDLLKTDVQFMMYGVTSAKEKSGAYLFLPDGPAKKLVYTSPYIRLMRGQVASQIQSFMPTLEHSITLYNSPGLDGLSVEIHNTVDIRQENNRELVMRVATNIKNSNIFYSDLNGFQSQKRKTYSKLPLQANFYPMPTMSFIEDDHYRFSILSGQSLGCASLEQGWLEVMQDRRLNQDDNRGLAQGVLDSKKTLNRFKFLFEKRQSGKANSPDQHMGHASISSHITSLELIHPIVIMPQTATTNTNLQLHTSHHTLSNDLSCDLHLVNLRSIQYPEHDNNLRFQPKDDIGLILHRLGVDCSFPAKALHCTMNDGQVQFSSLFKDLLISSVQHSSLSFINDLEGVDPKSTTEIPSMELQAYKIIVQ